MDPVDRTHHWDTYYSSDSVPLSPSQFAAFVHAEYPDHAIVDIGCGSGRDSMFFLSQGHEVIGLDASSEAILTCSSKALDYSKNSFIVSNISDPALCATVIDALVTAPKSIVLYARFFLHAITPTEQEHFFAFCSRMRMYADVVVAVEFRTEHDRGLKKATTEHFRRYLNPSDVIATASLQKFHSLYYVEGFGFAKYRDDDAHVARIIFAQGNE